MKRHIFGFITTALFCIAGLSVFVTGCNLQGLECRENGDCEAGTTCQAGWCLKKTPPTTKTPPERRKPPVTTCKEGATQSCTLTTGASHCRTGQQRCSKGAWGSCERVILPAVEICNGKDDDCNGSVDDGISCGCLENQQRDCYHADAKTKGVGICKAGKQTCSNGAWGACKGAMGPRPETCNNKQDDDCDGQVDEHCTATAACTPNQFHQTIGSDLSNAVEQVIQSPNARWLVASTQEENLLVWEQTQFKYALRFSSKATLLRVSPNSLYGAAALSNGKVALWELETGKLIKEIHISINALQTLEFSPDSKILLTHSISEKKTQEWSTKDGSLQRNWPVNSEGIYRGIVSFRADGKQLAGTYKNRKEVYIWDRTTFKTVVQFVSTCSYGILNLRFRSATNLVIVCRFVTNSKEELEHWDLSGATPRKSKSFSLHAGFADLALFNKDGSRLLVGQSLYGSKSWVYDVDSGKKLHEVDMRLIQKTSPTRFFTSDASGTFLIAAHTDKKVRFWSIAGTAVTKTLGIDFPRHHSIPLALAVDPTGKWLVSTAYDNRLLVWDMQSMTDKTPAKLVRELTVVKGRIYAASFDSTGARLAIADSKNEIHLLRTKDWTLEKTLSKHSSIVTDLAFSPKGDFLISASGYEKTIALWSLKDMKFVRYLKNNVLVDRLSVSPDGKSLAYLDGKVIELLSLPEGTSQLVLTPQKPPQGVAFHPNGQTLIYAAGPLFVYDLKEKQVIRSFLQNETYSRRMSLSSDGVLVATGTNAGDVALYNTTSGKRVGMVTQPQQQSKARIFSFGSQSRLFLTADARGVIRSWVCKAP